MKFYEYIKDKYPEIKSTLAIGLCNKANLDIVNIHANVDEDMQGRIDMILSKNDLKTINDYMPESAPKVKSEKKTYVPSVTDLKIVRMPYQDSLAIPQNVLDDYPDNDFCWVTANLLQEFKRKGYVPVGSDGAGSEWLTVGDGDGIGKSILMMISKELRAEYLKAPVVQDYKNRAQVPRLDY